MDVCDNKANPCPALEPSPVKEWEVSEKNDEKNEERFFITAKPEKSRVPLKIKRAYTPRNEYCEVSSLMGRYNYRLEIYRKDLKKLQEQMAQLAKNRERLTILRDEILNMGGVNPGEIPGFDFETPKQKDRNAKESGDAQRKTREIKSPIRVKTSKITGMKRFPRKLRILNCPTALSEHGSLIYIDDKGCQTDFRVIAQRTRGSTPVSRIPQCNERKPTKEIETSNKLKRVESLLQRTMQQNDHLKSQIREYERQMKFLGEQKRRLRSVVDTLEDKTRTQAEVITRLKEIVLQKGNNEHAQCNCPQLRLAIVAEKNKIAELEQTNMETHYMLKKTKEKLRKANKLLKDHYSKHWIKRIFSEILCTTN